MYSVITQPARRCFHHGIRLKYLSSFRTTLKISRYLFRVLAVMLWSLGALLTTFYILNILNEKNPIFVRNIILTLSKRRTTLGTLPTLFVISNIWRKTGLITILRAVTLLRALLSKIKPRPNITHSILKPIAPHLIRLAIHH